MPKVPSKGCTMNAWGGDWGGHCVLLLQAECKARMMMGHSRILMSLFILPVLVLIRWCMHTGEKKDMVGWASFLLQARG